MTFLGQVLAGASAGSILCGALTWGQTSAHVSVGYLGIAAVSASLALAIDWGRR
jgi:hypothetical protein